jgi:hypothetical protein
MSTVNTITTVLCQHPADTADYYLRRMAEKGMADSCRIDDDEAGAVIVQVGTLPPVIYRRMP